MAHCADGAFLLDEVGFPREAFLTMRPSVRPSDQRPLFSRPAATFRGMRWVFRVWLNEVGFPWLLGWLNEVGFPC